MEEILWESGYYTKKRIGNGTRDGKPDDTGKGRRKERKLRADKMLLEGKYKRAVKRVSAVIVAGCAGPAAGKAKIWHNMGTAYAKAVFNLNGRQNAMSGHILMGRMEESRQQYLTACACAEGENLGEENYNIKRMKKLKLVKGNRKA